MRTLILASTSPYRRALLQRLGIPFEVRRPAVSEASVDGEPPADRALRLSVAKAQAVAIQYPDSVVVGSDQVAASGAHILDKPGNTATCEAQLRRLAGSAARFHTGCAVVARGGAPSIHLDTTLVTFRSLTADEIRRYVAHEQPFDCAGGFKAEGLGISLFEAVESKDPTALIGLPLIWLSGALREAGYTLP
jgi:septum formation protein